MIKLWSALYVFFTSIIYFYAITTANKWYEDKHIAFPVLSAIVVFLAFLISFFKDKISDCEVAKKIKEKEDEISKLVSRVHDKEVIIHNLKSTFINNVLSAQEHELADFFVVQRALAIKLNADPVINNVGPLDDVDISSYLDILKTNSRPSIT